MEVDHFDPRKKKLKIQPYSNLVLATRSCNGAKGNKWPSARQTSEGKRFIDCTRELDYGEQIFEDPNTHELVGTTPAGKYQIYQCDLNAPHLVRERQIRAKLQAGLEGKAIWKLLRNSDIISDLGLFDDHFSATKELMDRMIPPIPPPPS